MADRFENGKDYLLFIKPATTWLTVACITTNGFEGTTDTIDGKSKCSGGWGGGAAGDKSWSMNADGNAIDSGLLPSEASYKALFNLWKSGDAVPIKIAKVGSDYVRYGEAYISSYSETQGNNEPFTFSSTFQGVSEPSDEEPAP